MVEEAGCMEERELVARARNGCPEAWGELVDRFHGRIFAFLHRCVGQAADAEDLCQDVFLRAFQKLDSFRSESRLSTWLYAIAANVARNWHRSESRRRRLRLAGSGGGDGPNVAAPAGDALERREPAEAVRCAVGSLRLRERTALILRTYEGLSYEEIGTVMNCSPSVVRNLLYRARKRLAAKLRHLMS